MRDPSEIAASIFPAVAHGYIGDLWDALAAEGWAVVPRGDVFDEPAAEAEPIVTGNYAAMEAAMAADAAAAEEQSVRTGGTLAPGGG